MATAESRPAATESLYLRWRLALVVILTILATIYLVAQFYEAAARFGSVLNFYFAAWVLQFLLAPPVEWLCARGWHRVYAALAAYLLILLVVMGILALLLPLFVVQLRDLVTSKASLLRAQDIPSLTRSLQQFVQAHAPDQARGFLNDLIVNAGKQAQAQLDDVSKSVLTNIRPLTASVTASTFSLVQTTLTWLFNTLIIVILSFIMTVSGEQAWRGLLAYVPRSLDPDIEAVTAVVNRAFGGFLRGQLILSGIYAALIWIILFIFAHTVGGGSDLANFGAVGAILAGMIMVIPLIGTTLSMVPPLLVGALTLQNWGHTLWLFLILWVLQLVMANAIGPRVISESVGVNPVWAFAALLLGAKLGGILGALFSVPLMAVGLAILDRIYRHIVPGGPVALPEDVPAASSAHARFTRNLPWRKKGIQRRR